MNLLLLIVNGSLIAGQYALAKRAGALGVAPLGLLAWQLLAAALAIGALAAWRGQWPRPTWNTLRYAAVAGVLGVSAPSLVTYSALAHVPAGLVGVIGALSPLFTYGIALWLGIERLRAQRAAGIVLGLAGVLALLLPRSALPDAAVLPWALLALGGPLLLAAGNVFRTRAWPPGLTPLGAASLMLALQALLVLPLALWRGEGVMPGTAFGEVDRLLMGAAALTTAFYLGAFELQRRAGPVVVGQLGYVITVVSLLLGAWCFDERYGPATLLAVAVIFAGVLLVHRAPAAAGPIRLPSPRGCTP